MNRIKAASWGSRFWAWLIDVLLVSVIWYLLITAQTASTKSFSSLGIQSVLMFLYWTALEGYRGQSLGKMVLNLQIVGSSGEKIGFIDSALESFGKAFLLPLDCLLGWLAFSGSGQRFSNRITDTLVVYIGDEMNT